MKISEYPPGELPNGSMMGALGLSNIQKVCKYDQEGNATDQRPTYDNMQKRNTEQRRQQNVSNTLPTSPRTKPLK